LVLVYSGGLSISWHIPDKIFGFFKRFKEVYDNAFFLVLTTDFDLIDDLRAKYDLASEDIFAAEIDNREIRKYLNAADLSLLLREDVPLNNVASPTKFAEYLMCGLPVVISPNVGDYSRLVAEKKIGYVYEEDHSAEIIRSIINPILNNSEEDKRKTLSDWGIEAFSKQSNLQRIIGAYENIFKE